MTLDRGDFVQSKDDRPFLHNLFPDFCFISYFLREASFSFSSPSTRTLSGWPRLRCENDTGTWKQGTHFVSDTAGWERNGPHGFVILQASHVESCHECHVEIIRIFSTERTKMPLTSLNLSLTAPNIFVKLVNKKPISHNTFRIILTVYDEI